MKIVKSNLKKLIEAYLSEGEVFGDQIFPGRDILSVEQKKQIGKNILGKLEGFDAHMIDGERKPFDSKNFGTGGRKYSIRTPQTAYELLKKLANSLISLDRQAILPAMNEYVTHIIGNGGLASHSKFLFEELSKLKDLYSLNWRKVVTNNDSQVAPIEFMSLIMDENPEVIGMLMDESPVGIMNYKNIKEV